MNKRELRHYFSTLRKFYVTEYPNHLSKMACQACLHLKDLLYSLPSLTSLALYMPLSGEIDLRPLLSNVPFQKIFYPGVFKNEMLFYQDMGREWQVDDKGILCPVSRETGTPECVIIPVLGFDKFGYRLGYGGGYYDKTLSQITTHKIYLGYSFQEVCQLPHTATDIRANILCTDRGVYEIDNT